jgi:hypothetical protein
MPEMSTREHELAVSRVYEAALAALADGTPLTPVQRVVHDVEHLMQEANSGASFEQYFRWADPAEIAAILGHLRALGLARAEQVTARAIALAFPDGVPASVDDMDSATDWSHAQRDGLAALFVELEEDNGHVMNVLGAHVLRAGG